MNHVMFRSGEFLAIKCKTPDAFLVVQALSDSPDFRTQPLPLDKLTFQFRWYKRSFSYENGSDMYTAGRNDSNLYKFVICTVNVNRVSNSTCLIEAPERFRVLRELREQLSSNDVGAGGGFGGLEAAVKGEDEHTIFGMVPLGVVARTVLNDATFYLVMWKGLPDRYT